MIAPLLSAVGTGVLAFLQVRCYITPKDKRAAGLFIPLIALFVFAYLMAAALLWKIIITAASLLLFFLLGVKCFQEDLYCKLYNMLMQAIVSTLCLFAAEHICAQHNLIAAALFLALQGIWCCVMYLMRRRKFTTMPFGEKYYRSCFIMLSVSYVPLLLLQWDRRQIIAGWIQKDILLFIILVYIFLIAMILNSFLVRKSELVSLNRLKAISLQRHMLTQYVDNLKTEQQRMRVMHHDQSHFIKALLALMEENDNARAIQLIKEMHYTLHSSLDAVFCEDPLINAILADTKARAGEMGVDLHTSIRIDEEIVINDMDMAAMLLNAINNAFENYRRYGQDGEKRISIAIYTTGGHLVFRIQNQVNREIVISHNRILTSKNIENETHGIGLESIETIAKRHGGEMRLSVEKSVFTLQAILENKYLAF